MALPLGGWTHFFERLRQHAASRTVPSLNQIQPTATPFQILVSTILSLRTRDEVTLRTSASLFERAKTPEAVLGLSEDELARLIFPSAFYRTKAKQIQKIAQKLAAKEFPRTRVELLELPGVGPKTANLVMNLAWGTPAICVDTHVHRISNRLGWIQTKTPRQSEAALEKILPQEHWIEINILFVQWGQNCCTPLSPRCSECFLNAECPQIGVTKRR